MGSRSERTAALVAATAVLVLVVSVIGDGRRVADDARRGGDRSLSAYEFRSGSWLTEPLTWQRGCARRGSGDQPRRDSR